MRFFFALCGHALKAFEFPLLWAKADIAQQLFINNVPDHDPIK
jgi:hypothetical protein